MKINIVCVGNLKEKYLKEAVAEYSKRLSAFADLKIVELKEEQTDPVNRESKSILAVLKGYVVLTAINGKELSSPEIANFISEKTVSGTSEFTFVIGGSYGVSQEVFDRADFKMSFGKITLPHQLFRVVLLEQIYRAFSILNHSPYHK